MTASTQLAWKIRCMKLLRRTTRPEDTHPFPILSVQEIHLLDAAYQAGLQPKEIVRVLVRRDKSLSRTAQGAGTGD